MEEQPVLGMVEKDVATPARKNASAAFVPMLHHKDIRMRMHTRTFAHVHTYVLT